MSNAVSAVPDLIDALVTLGQSVAGVTVYDGPGDSDDPGDYLMIGVDDPDSPATPKSADTQQDWALLGYEARDEEGDITCAALSWNGDAGGQKAARDAAYAVIANFGAALKANPSLGLDHVLWTSFGTTTSLSQLQSADGVLALVTFTVHFKARL